MILFNIYIRENESDNYLTYYTTIEANSQEEAEKIAEDIVDSIQSAKENYESEDEYDRKGDQL